MNTSFQRVENTTDEWYTPKYILDALGRFDLDPCAPAVRAFDTAARHYTKAQDGLSLEWHGRVWLNPPYSHPLFDDFMIRMWKHENGIALIHSRTDTKLFHDEVLKRAHALMFLRGRIKFLRPDGTQGGSPGIGQLLVAYGDENVRVLANCKLDGHFVLL